MPLHPDLVARVTTLLCDADGNLFPSEEPAFAASARLTNELLERIGSPVRWDADELRRVALGRNFRALAQDLLSEHRTALPDDELEDWVRREQQAVTAHLGDLLVPDEAVRRPLTDLGRHRRLALVSSSALARLDACLAATDLAGLFPPHVRYSAQDSLPRPTSKPDPAVYALAVEELGVDPEHALAVEDATSGVVSAAGAGVAVVGNLAFVPRQERTARRAALLDAGAADVVESWAALADALAVAGETVG